MRMDRFVQWVQNLINCNCSMSLPTLKWWTQWSCHGLSCTYSSKDSPLSCRSVWLRIFTIMSLLNILPPTFLDLNPLVFYILGIIERENNKQPHSIKGMLKAAIMEVMRTTWCGHALISNAVSRWSSKLRIVLLNDFYFLFFQVQHVSKSVFFLILENITIFSYCISSFFLD